MGPATREGSTLALRRQNLLASGKVTMFAAPSCGEDWQAGFDFDGKAQGL
jgi:hypothetical protein